ncbi:TatD family hydrolase [Flavobacterium restrictum]|uniref:TatD family deoxyribonuclease n=1 Tax=Flavobacterium restrictum TaxID=2594428 RepID=A0A553DY22_9FLAO|nr:TatD family hydrolase [Flavobacterium restrictum]TRX37595.1 TatD family deoxyribonuclease [Flavobacterium restrictum]
MEFFNLHTHLFTNQACVKELVNQYPQEFDGTIPFYSIGIHPWFIVKERLESDLAIIESKLQEPNCLAVGECGLDKRIEIPMELQKIVFESQLLLAQKHQKPVVIHCVAAFQELLAIVKQLKITVPIVIHGFSKKQALVNELLASGCYISFGKYLLQNPELESVFKSMPMDRFFLETDTAQQGIEVVYALAARYKGIPMAALQQQINTNFEAVFKINK